MMMVLVTAPILILMVMVLQTTKMPSRLTLMNALTRMAMALVINEIMMTMGTVSSTLPMPSH